MGTLSAFLGWAIVILVVLFLTVLIAAFWPAIAAVASLAWAVFDTLSERWKR